MPGRVRHTLRLLTIPTEWPRAPRSTRWALLVFALGFASILLPRGVGWTGDHLHSEDGQVFLSEHLAYGLGALLRPYAGYLHVVPRLVTGACDAVTGPGGFAGCLTVGSGLVRTAAGLVAFPVLCAYARSWRWGLAAAVGAFLLLPTGQQEVLGNITNLRWFLVAGAFFALMGVFRRPWLAAYASAIALLAALSDPLALLLIPFAIWRLVAVRGWARVPAGALMVGSLVHILSLDTSARGERGGLADLLTAPVQTVGQLLVRGPLTTQWGLTLTQDLAHRLGFPLAIATLVLTIVLLVLGWRGRRVDDPAVPFAILLILMGLGLLLVTLSFPASYIALADFWSPSQPGRYSALTGLFLTPVLVLAMSRAWRSRRDPRLGPVWTVLMCVILAAAYIGDAGGDARNTDGPTWSQTIDRARSICAESGSDPTLPNSPVYEGWTTRLTCDWVGVG